MSLEVNTSCGRVDLLLSNKLLDSVCMQVMTFLCVLNAENNLVTRKDYAVNIRVCRFWTAISLRPSAGTDRLDFVIQWWTVLPKVSMAARSGSYLCQKSLAFRISVNSNTCLFRVDWADGRGDGNFSLRAVTSKFLARAEKQRLEDGTGTIVRSWKLNFRPFMSDSVVQNDLAG